MEELKFFSCDTLDVKPLKTINISNKLSLESPFTGTVYVQTNEKYYIKCNHCEINFELIQKFTKHCINTHQNVSIKSPTYDEGNNQNLNTRNFCTDSSSEFKKEINEHINNEEKSIKETEIENPINIICSPDQDNDRLIQENSEETHERTEKLKCKLCQTQLTTSSSLRRHMKSQKCKTAAEGKSICFKCTICDKEFSQNRILQNHKLTHQTDVILTCKHCQTEFNENEKLLAHLKTHSEEGKPHQCEICSKKFSTKYKLKCHTASVHSSEPFYKCSQCSTAFRSNHKLREHKSEVHNGPPKQKCKYCPKLFLRLCDLQVHERIHTGEKPYQCEICGRSFAVSYDLTNHYKRHTNERNFKCDQCGKCFFNSLYLRDHMVTHTKIKSFSCEICNTRFTLRSALTKHKKLHSGIKEYICKLCGKEYAQNAGLYKHMRTHKIAQEK